MHTHGVTVVHKPVKVYSFSWLKTRENSLNLVAISPVNFRMTRQSEIGNRLYSKRTPNDWMVCETWPHQLVSQPHHTSVVRYHVHTHTHKHTHTHTHIYLRFCHGFITLFIMYHFYWYRLMFKKLKCCIQVRAMLHMNSNLLVCYFALVRGQGLSNAFKALSLEYLLVPNITTLL